jgi:ATP-dependent Clp protease protease subunit
MNQNEAYKLKYDIKAAKNDIGEVYIYGVITNSKWDDTDVTASSFQKELNALGNIKTLNLFVKSPGGSAFEGLAIKTILERHPAYKNGYVDSIAASAGSWLLMACNKIYMAADTFQFIHFPIGPAYGNAKDLRSAADNLDKIGESMLQSYVAKSNGKATEEKLRELLDAESLLTAQECFDIGLCDEILEAKNIAAKADIMEILAAYGKNPEEYETKLDNLERCAGGVKSLSVTERQAIIEESKKLVDQIKNKMEVL